MMNTGDRLSARRGETGNPNEKEAVGELYDKIYQPEMEAVIFFCSSRYDLTKLSIELKDKFPCTLIGCTTAGEISSLGYQEGGIAGVSLSSPELKVHTHTIAPLNRFGLSEARKLADRILKELSFSDRIQKERMFGFLLIDGLSLLEEQVAAALYNPFEGVSIIGGSAGDDLQFRETKVYADGNFVSDAATFTLFETTLPFYVFKTQHFKPTNQKLVITEAKPSHRIVTEINAEPSAQEFARILGLQITDLGPRVFSKYPLMLKIGDEWYVRSIQKVNDDKSLTFYCAIDVGLVLTVAEGVDLISNLKDKLKELFLEIPDPKLIIGCDCILRKLEIFENGNQQEAGQLLTHANFIGFSTYGEQFDSVHVNQTLTGIAIGG